MQKCTSDAHKPVLTGTVCRGQRKRLKEAGLMWGWEARQETVRKRRFRHTLGKYGVIFNERAFWIMWLPAHILQVSQRERSLQGWHWNAVNIRHQSIHSFALWEMSVSCTDWQCCEKGFAQTAYLCEFRYYILYIFRVTPPLHGNCHQCKGCSLELGVNIRCQTGVCVCARSVSLSPVITHLCTCCIKDACCCAFKIPTYTMQLWDWRWCMQACMSARMRKMQRETEGQCVVCGMLCV